MINKDAANLESETDRFVHTYETVINPENQSEPLGKINSHEKTLSSTPLARSLAAYLADLPELLVEHNRKWVVYADGQRLRFGNSLAELYRYCLNDLHLPHDRFIIRRIMPESSPQIEYTLRGNN